MRIAIPISGGAVAESPAACEAFRFYEDDHGRIVNTFLVPAEGRGVDAALRLLERYGIDALVTPLLENAERGAIMSSGILLSMTAQRAQSADEAALAYLGGAIAFDPNNTCTACGDGLHACSMGCPGCGGK